MLENSCVCSKVFNSQFTKLKSFKIGLEPAAWF